MFMGASIHLPMAHRTRPGANAHAHGPVLGESENSKLTDPFGPSGSTTGDAMQVQARHRQRISDPFDFSLRNDDARDSPVLF